MMLVKILGFGSDWWARFGSDPGDRYRFTRHAAYFNSTGLRCGSKIRRHWIVPGLIRFNGTCDVFTPHFPSRSEGVTFECTNLAFALGGNRILFQKKAAHSALPDHFLSVVSSDRLGMVDFHTGNWKSPSVTTVAASESGEKQEVMLLMRPFDWLRTTLGVWQLKVERSRPHGAAVELLEDGERS
jgi:hypothetical protein